MPTTAQLLDLDGIRQRSDAFRFELLDRNGDMLGELAPQSGNPATITNDVARRVPRSLNDLRLNPADAAEVDIISNRVRVVMVLQNGAQFSLGLFLWADDSRPRHSWGISRNSTLIDKSYILDQPIGKTTSFKVGTTALAAFRSVALGVLTADELHTEDPAVSFGAAVAWPATATRLEILSDISDKVGFLPPYFDRDGILIWRQVPEVTTAEATISFQAGGRIIAGSIVESDNLLNAPNRYVVIDTSGAAPIVGSWDIPATAPHSILNRGFPVVHTEPMQGIPNVAQAVEAARAFAKRDTSTLAWAQFASTADPRLDTWDVLGFLDEVYLSIAWRLPLFSGGEMSHTLRRVYS